MPRSAHTAQDAVFQNKLMPKCCRHMACQSEHQQDIQGFVKQAEQICKFAIPTEKIWKGQDAEPHGGHSQRRTHQPA